LTLTDQISASGYYVEHRTSVVGVFDPVYIGIR